MVLERKLLTGDHAGDMSPVTARILSEIKDAVQELRSSEPDSVLVSLAERKIEVIERHAANDPGSGKECLDMSAARNG